MADPRLRFEELQKRFRERGYRLTPQRIALLRMLAENRSHPSASHLYRQIRKRFPTTSLATVYKTLALLKDMGEVLELGFGEDNKRYDGNIPYPHPHLICVRCHSIVDPEVTVLSHLEQEVASVSGYDIIGHRLDFYGICPECKVN